MGAARGPSWSPKRTRIRCTHPADTHRAYAWQTRATASAWAAARNVPARPARSDLVVSPLHTAPPAHQHGSTTHRSPLMMGQSERRHPTAVPLILSMRCPSLVPLRRLRTQPLWKIQRSLIACRSLIRDVNEEFIIGFGHLVPIPIKLYTHPHPHIHTHIGIRFSSCLSSFGYRVPNKSHPLQKKYYYIIFYMTLTLIGHPTTIHYQ